MLVDYPGLELWSARAPSTGEEKTKRWRSCEFLYSRYIWPFSRSFSRPLSLSCAKKRREGKVFESEVSDLQCQESRASSASLREAVTPRNHIAFDPRPQSRPPKITFPEPRVTAMSRLGVNNFLNNRQFFNLLANLQNNCLSENIFFIFIFQKAQNIYKTLHKHTICLYSLSWRNRYLSRNIFSIIKFSSILSIFKNDKKTSIKMSYNIFKNILSRF